MAIVARAIDYVARMFELLAVRCQQFEFFGASLRENRVTELSTRGIGVSGVSRPHAFAKNAHASATNVTLNPRRTAFVLAWFVIGGESEIAFGFAAESGPFGAANGPNC